MKAEFEQQLIDAAQRRLSADLLPGFENLPEDAQADVALTLLNCAANLPPVIGPEHIDELRRAVDQAVANLPNPANVKQ